MQGTTEADRRLITEERAQELYSRIQSLQHGSGKIVVTIQAWWSGELRWARNRVSVASDRRDISVWIGRQNEMGAGSVSTNQTDNVSLEAAVRAAERKMRLGDGRLQLIYSGLEWFPPRLPFPETPIWSDATYEVTPEQRSALARTLTAHAEAEQLQSAGFLRMRVGESRIFGSFSPAVRPMSPDVNVREGTGAGRTAREVGYVRHTEAQCSMTVRHPKGQGSGWAGLSSYDWSAIDAAALVERAIEKCKNSLHPVAIEPGRYTVILEPQAVAQIVGPLVGVLQERRSHENLRAKSAMSLDVDSAVGVRYTKLGLKIIDERISISHNPTEPMLGILPSLGLQPVTWIEHGVLKTMGYGRDKNPTDYSLGILNDNLPIVARGSYSMTGGDTSIDEMISTTARGVLVSRFSNFSRTPAYSMSLVFTGITRDGLWLVENGKISKAVKNMRFVDSPLFVLNQIQQLGPTIPVFNPSESNLRPVIVPPLKANDFAFTASVDAV